MLGAAMAAASRIAESVEAVFIRSSMGERAGGQTPSHDDLPHAHLLRHRCEWALKESLDHVSLRARILFAEVDERLEIICLKQDEADEVGARRLLRAETA